VTRMDASLAGLVLAFALAAGPAGAAQVYLDPASLLVAPGEGFTLDLVLDATGSPGAKPGDYIGQVVVDYDPARARYDGFTISSPAQLTAGPSLGTAGALATVTLGFRLTGQDVGTLGTFSFTALGPVDSTVALGLGDADDFFGSFVNKAPTDLPFFPVLVGAEIEVVPLPAAAWLFLSALGAAGLGRRARR